MTLKKVPVKVHLTKSEKRAAKVRADRERILEWLDKKLEHTYQLNASVKRVVNQFLEMELVTEKWKLSEVKTREAKRYDGYYVLISNNLELSTKEVSEIYRELWKFEESFRVLKNEIKTQPIHVLNDAHIRGCFSLCFLALNLKRYAQHLGMNGIGSQTGSDEESEISVQ